MMAEAFLRLRGFSMVESYRYVGMGSVYFSDFSLFHDICGFQQMISIEYDQTDNDKRRFSFNVPLGNIDLQFGSSNDILPTLAWDVRSAVWMDYDGPLTKSVLTDLRYLSSKISSGSIICVSVNANLADEEDSKKAPLDVLKSNLESASKIPTHVVTEGKLLPRNVFGVLREIMGQEIQDGLNDRNAGRPTGQRFSKEQVMFFRYADRAQMLTIGWVIFDEGQRPNFLGCNFNSLSFFQASDVPFIISPPLLTGAEMRAINRADDSGRFGLLSDLPFPADEVAKYEALKRYWPIVSVLGMT